MANSFFPVTFYSFYTFEGNYIELKRTLKRYSEMANGDEMLTGEILFIDLGVSAGRELSRLIHNYAASWLSLVDHTRRIYKHLQESEHESIREFAKEYDERLSRTLRSCFENKFVKDLRRYAQHKAVPVPTLNFEARRVEESPQNLQGVYFKTGFSFKLQSKDLEDFDWSSDVRKYIQSRRTIPIGEILEKHFWVMQDFYLWIQFRESQLSPYGSQQKRQETFEFWKQRHSQD